MTEDDESTVVFSENHADSAGHLNAVLADDEQILVVASQRSQKSDAFPWHALAGKSVHWFADFTSNPTLSAACAAAALVSELRPAAILGVGGGSAIDVAKAAAVLPPDVASALEVIRSGRSLCRLRLGRPTPRVIAVPTLFGSGAEVTQFATTFYCGHKVSVDSVEVRPDIAFIDPSLAAGAPHAPTSAAALDALCHAIESAWSRSATAGSLKHSRKALEQLARLEWKNDGAYSHEDRRTLAAGALSAGRAINVTRTTAAHASAYMLTIRYGIPHGVACALNMQWVSRSNTLTHGLNPEVAHVVEASLGIAPTDLPGYFRKRLHSADWAPDLRSYGVGRRDLPAIAEDAIRQSRLRNNPVELTVTDVLRGLTTIL